MTDLQGTFAVNLDDTTAKVMDGELVVIRLSDGSYYSSENVGVCVWECIEAGQILTEVVQIVSSRYDAPVDRVERDVRTLFETLLEEGLIVRQAFSASEWDGGAPPRNGTATLKSEASAPEDAQSVSAVYETPRLNIYRDMGNLLALDPPTPGIDDLYWGKTAG